MEEIKLDENNNESQNKNKNKIEMIIIGGVFILLAIIVGAVFLFSDNDNTLSLSYLNYKNYSKIQDGMTYSEVVEILEGHQGVLDTSSSYGGYNLSYYTWSDSLTTKCIVVGFENGKVCAKSQIGLW